MFWNKKKPKSKPQIKTTVPKTFKAKEPPPKWQPTFGETKKKGEKPPEVTTKSEPKIDWEDKFLKSFQKLTYRRRAWEIVRLVNSSRHIMCVNLWLKWWLPML